MTSYKDKEIRLNYNSDNQSLPTNWKNIFSHLGKICSLTSAQNFLSKALLCTLIMFMGVGEVWAADYKYIIINNKGNEAFNYIISTGTTYTSIDKTKFCVHLKAKSVLATNFRFYTTKAAAQDDANGTIGTHYSEGDAIPDPTNENKTFYVRYDLVGDPAININAESVYKLQVRDRNKKWYYIVYDGSANTIKMKTAEGSTDSYFWKFDSGDPYDMYILNLQGLTDNANGVFTVPNVVTSTGEKEESTLSAIYYRNKITTDYNQSASSMNLQSFILTQGSNVGFNYDNNWKDVWSNSFQIIGAFNGLDNKPKDTPGTSSTGITPGNMPYYVCANNAANNSPLQFYRNWRVEDPISTNVSQIKFIVVTQKYTFHIINNSGEEAISMKTDNALNAGATIEETMIPNMLKSPAACNYTFYPTAADAAAKTNAITTLPQDDDIYVRYETSSSDIYLNGGMKYNLSVGGEHYLYAADATTTTISSAATCDAVDSYRWALYGGDPYQITIKNKNNKFITYDVSGGEATPTLSATGSKFFLHQSTSGYYELVAVPSNNYPTSYYTLGYGTDGLKLYSNTNSNTNYSFGADEIQTVFTPIPAAIINPLPTANNRTYDGSTQNLLLTAGTCEHGTIKYREGTEGEYVEDIPTKKDAGTYSVYYMSEGKDGYEDFIATDPIEVTISPAQVTVTAENKSKTYGETDPTLTATVTGLISGESESLIKYTLSRVVGEDAKTYTITPTGDALQDNYTVSFVTGNLTVNKKTVGITWGETSFPYNGTQQAPTATATGLVNNDEIGITVSGAKTNVGTYTATASGLTGTKKGNYQLPDTKTTTFSIVKAEINTDIIMTEWSYGDYDASVNSPSVSFNPDNATVTYQYKVKGADAATYVTTVPTEVGTYTVQASMSETNNHYSKTVTKNFTISKKALNKDAAGTPANGITVTVTKNMEANPPTYNVTVTHNIQGTPTTLTQFVDAEHDYDYEVSGSQSVSGHVVTVTAKNNNGIYTGNYTGFAKTAYANPIFYQDGATWSPSGDEYAAVYLGIYDLVPSQVASGSEIKAYIVRKVNPTIGTVTVSPVEYTIDDSTNPPTKANYIPGDVPVLLLSNNVNSTGFQTSSTTEDTSDITAVAGYNNQLKLAPDVLTDPEDPESPRGVPVEDAEAYVFYRGEFVLTKKGTISPGKFFLYNPNYTPSAGGGGGSSGVRSLRIVMDEDEDPTGIDNGQQTMVNGQLNDIWYTLDGRRLEGKPTRKGIYITNGKKIYFK